MKTAAKFFLASATISLLSLAASASNDPGDVLINWNNSNPENFSSAAPSLFLALLGFVVVYTVMYFLITKIKKQDSLSGIFSGMLSAKAHKLNTENKALKKRIKELDIFSAVVMHSNSGVVIADNEGEIEWMNPGFVKMTGYTLEKWKQIRGSTIFDSSFNIHIAGIMHQVIRIGKTVTYKTVIFTRHCKKIWVSSSITPLFDAKGELEKFIIIDTDITAQKTAEEEWKKEKESAGRQQDERAMDIQFSVCE